MLMSLTIDAVVDVVQRIGHAPLLVVVTVFGREVDGEGVPGGVAVDGV